MSEKLEQILIDFNERVLSELQSLADQVVHDHLPLFKSLFADLCRLNDEIYSSMSYEQKYYDGIKNDFKVDTVLSEGKLQVYKELYEKLDKLTDDYANQ